MDIDYPQNLHNVHDEFPFLAQDVCPPNSEIKKIICSQIIKTLFCTTAI